MSNMRFPQMHIATSVVNRLLNLRDEMIAEIPIPSPIPSPIPIPAPNVADPLLEGIRLDAAVAAPVKPTSVEGADPLTARVATGGNLIGALQ